MDIDIKMAEHRFQEFLPEGRNLQMITDRDLLTCSEKLIVLYDGPKVESFNTKLDNVLIRFGWDLEEVGVDSKTKQVYIKLTRDFLIDPQVQGKRLIEARLAEKPNQTGLRDIRI
jgi:hypothetical protein